MICILLCVFKYDRVLIKPGETEGAGKFYPGFISSALWVKANLKDARILVDDDQFSTYSWMVYADKIGRNERTDELSIAVQALPDSWKDSIAISTKFHDLIRQEHVTHITLFSHGGISARLNFHNDLDSLRDLRFAKIYENSGFRIYKVLSEAK